MFVCVQTPGSRAALPHLLCAPAASSASSDTCHKHTLRPRGSRSGAPVLCSHVVLLLQVFFFILQFWVKKTCFFPPLVLSVILHYTGASLLYSWDEKHGSYLFISGGRLILPLSRETHNGQCADSINAHIDIQKPL